MMRRRTGAFLLCVVAAAALAGLVPATSSAAFGLTEPSLTFTNSAGEPQVQAGAHPYALNFGFNVNRTEKGGKTFADQSVKDVINFLPPGVVAKPTATPRCTNAEFTDIDENSRTACPASSAVGLAHIRTIGTGSGFGPGEEVGDIAVPVFNLAPAKGSLLKLGLVVLKAPILIEAGLNQNPPYNGIGASINISQALEVFGAELILWGDPADSSHDPFRGNCIESIEVKGHLGEVISRGNCPYEVPGTPEPFLTMATGCSSVLQSTVEADSWQQPGPPYSYRETVTTRDSGGTPLAPNGCANVSFAPSITAQPKSSFAEPPPAESPIGLDFTLNVENPGLTEQGGLSGSAIEKAVVTLPEGVTTNPSVATGLGACGLAEFQNETINTAPGAGCPESSKVGTVEVESQLLEEEVEGHFKSTILHGSVYVAKQHDNPFDNLLTILMVIKDPDLGIFIKLPGRVEPNPATGQLKTTFGEPGYELPELPFSHFRFHFRTGARAPLITPATCGTYTTQADLYPYSAPGSPRTQTATFTINGGAHGGACAGAPGQLPNRPWFSAGTLSPLAGIYTPFVLQLSREDGSQQFSSISTTLPKGLTGRLAGIPYCSEADIARASSMGNEGQGALELAAPSCPHASEVGTVTVGSGAGPEPLYVTGHAYLAGPYRGAPLSLEIITPAIAGPFDLGVVAVRTALQVNLETAEITAISDPIPRILHGLPLDVRSIAIEMGRPNFIINPTSCEPKMILGSETSTLGSVAPLSQYFQVSNCGALNFKPTLKLNLKGQTKRSGHPALKATLTYPKNGAYANIAAAQVGLPHSEFLDQGNLDKVCTQPELRSASCPATSVYGHAKAWTPLLEKPLEGPVYLGVGFGYKLPALVADLNGQVRILLKGRVDTTKHEGIRTTFEAVPDAPVSKFILEMKGGKKYGLLENSENICRKPQKASARFTAQNGKVVMAQPQIGNSCKKSKKSKKQHSAKKKHGSSKHRSR